MDFNIRPLNENLSKIAREVLNEVDERIPTDIATLQHWIQQQPHLRANTDPQNLLSFLRGCKHSLEKTKSKIEYFYMIKTLMPEIFKNKQMDEKFCEFARSGTYIWPPRLLNYTEPPFSIVRLRNMDCTKFKLIDIFRYNFMGLELVMRNNDHCMIIGHIEIYDLADVPFEIYKQFDAAMMKKLHVFSWKGMPLRYKGVHILNCPKKYLHILNYLEIFMPDKIKSRMHIHESIDSLYDFIPRERLPEEYGGSNGTILEIAKQNEAEMLAINDLLIEDDNYGMDVSLKLNNFSINEKSIFGLDGSFRKLIID